MKNKCRSEATFNVYLSSKDKLTLLSGVIINIYVVRKKKMHSLQKNTTTMWAIASKTCFVSAIRFNEAGDKDTIGAFHKVLYFDEG